jgi:integrase/recombinase XerD
MSDYLELMKQNMTLRGFSPHTHNAYLRELKLFENFHQQPAEDLNETHIRQYLLYLISTKKLSHSSVNIAYSALKFFYEFSLKRLLVLDSIPRAKRERRLPVVLSADEIQQILASLTSIKQQAIIMTIYGGGLRLSEATNLRIEDIDSKNMQIRVLRGKGNSTRYTILSQKNLLILREYWKMYRPDSWLFPSPAKSDSPLNPRSIESFFSNARRKAGIIKPASIHSLRHSFATHLLENGVNLRIIQQLLGHRDIDTTCLYLHLVSPKSLQISSPLDLWKVDNHGEDTNHG